MTPDQAAAWVEERLGWAGRAERLEQGLVNEVFRVRALPPGDQQVIVKHAPPYVASRPEIPLDPGRARFEAAALMACRGRPARNLRSPVLRAAEGPTLAMEDLGDLPSLDRWLLVWDEPAVLTELGVGLRALHERGDAPALDNRGVQETRLAVQYAPVGTWLASAGIDDAERLGDRAHVLGRRLLDPGDVWVHGDLWPASILIDDGQAFLIDWELSTRGRRCQDVGHLAAHLWMLSHRRGLDPGAAGRFLRGYAALGEQDAAETAIHFGCEILARTLGAFQEGYVYEGLAADSEVVMEAVGVAAEAIRGEELPEVVLG